MNVQPRFLTFSQLLEKRLFRIPRYQRAYSWTRKERAAMFEDIAKLKDRPKNSHFMATVVGLNRETYPIVTDEYDIIEIVDGQQRLTTLVMLLKAIEQELTSLIGTVTETLSLQRRVLKGNFKNFSSNRTRSVPSCYRPTTIKANILPTFYEKERHLRFQMPKPLRIASY